MAKEVKVSIEISARDMYHFMLYHQYHSLTGVCYIIFGMMALGMMFYAIFNMSFLYVAVMGLLFFFCILYQPFGLYRKAARQIRKNESFRRPITYVFHKDGVEVRQGENRGELLWEDVSGVVLTKDLLMIYCGRIRANILPVSQLGPQQAAVLQCISEHIPQKRLKRIGNRR